MQSTDIGFGTSYLTFFSMHVSRIIDLIRNILIWYSAYFFLDMQQLISCECHHQHHHCLDAFLFPVGPTPPMTEGVSYCHILSHTLYFRILWYTTTFVSFVGVVFSNILKSYECHRIKALVTVLPSHYLVKRGFPSEAMYGKILFQVNHVIITEGGWQSMFCAGISIST